MSELHFFVTKRTQPAQKNIYQHYMYFFVYSGNKKNVLRAASGNGAANNVQRIAQIQLLKKKFCYATM